MGYLSPLLQRLLPWESVLWTISFLCGILAPTLGVIAWKVGELRSAEERRRADEATDGVRQQLAATREALDTSREQLDAKDWELAALAAEARRKALELEIKQTPRTLTGDQVSGLGRLLRGTAGTVVVSSVMGDGEGLRFAEQLVAALRNAGWQTQGVNQNVYDRNPVGLRLVIRDRSEPPVGTYQLMAAMRQIGLDVRGVVSRRVESNVIELMVGNKP
jgi:hypothetical protein